MRKGRILKVRIGHEANCSTSMVIFEMLLFSAPAYLLLSGVAAALDARFAAAGKRRRRAIFFATLGLGVVPAAALLIYAFASGIGSWTAFVPLTMMGVYLISAVLGYVLVPRVGYWACLISPVVVVLGGVAFWYVIFGW